MRRKLVKRKHHSKAEYMMTMQLEVTKDDKGHDTGVDYLKLNLKTFTITFTLLLVIWYLFCFIHASHSEKLKAGPLVLVT